MGRPRKNTQDLFYDQFQSWALADQKIALKVMERLVIEREKDERRATAKEKE